MLNGWSLKSKLLALSSVLSMALALVGGIAIFYLNEVSTKYEHVSKINLGNADTLGDMQAAFGRAWVALVSTGIQGISSAQLNRASQDVTESIKNYETANKSYTAIEFVKGEAELYAPVEENWKIFKEGIPELEKLGHATSSSDRERLVRILLTEGAERSQRFMTAIDRLQTFQTEQAAQWVALAEQSASRARYLSVTLTLVGLAFAFSVSWQFAGSISRALKKIADHLSNGAEEVASASSEISASSESLSASSTEQAASLQETAASLEELSSMVNRNAQNASRSKSAADLSQKAATKGKDSVNQMIHAITEITDSNEQITKQVENSNQQLTNIAEVIIEIGSKTKVINDIVFQTKLLSFNASVEAARAGEYGKGFAVVAEEVGNLALMSGKAAKEISLMLESSTKNVQTIVEETKANVASLVATGKEKLKTGVEVAERCGTVLDEVLSSVDQVNTMANEIAEASQEQARGIQEITKAMGQLDQTTQQNASAAQQAASSSEQLSAQAQLVRAMVDSLVSNVDGGTAPTSDFAEAQAKRPVSRKPSEPKLKAA